MKHKRLILIIVFSIILFVVCIVFIRAFSERYLDDLHPDISCDKSLIEKADILYVIPKFNNHSIAENPEWCKYILSFNKKIAMHGIYHTYREFSKERTQEYVDEGIQIFRNCFGYAPDEFKPPQLEISDENKKLLQKQFKLILLPEQVLHKDYHCNDTGKYSNLFEDIF